jgi:hypothetical protein
MRDTLRTPARRRRTLAVRACCSLCSALVAFLMVQVTVIVFTENARPEVGHAEHGYRLRVLQQRLAEDPGRPLFLVLGSSRTETGFRPETLPPTSSATARPLLFNFGLSSTGPLEELVHLRRLLHDGVRPRWMLIEILPGAFCSPDCGLAHYDKLDRTGWRDLRTLRHFHAPTDVYTSWCWSRLAACYLQRFPILSYYAPTLVPEENRKSLLRDAQDRTGWLTWKRSVSPEEYARGLKAARDFYYGPMQNLFIGDVPDRALRELLDVCRRHDIRAGLLLMPEGSEFRSWYSAAGWTTLGRYVDAVARDFDVPVIDARDWMADALFMDGHHLLPEGATAFTQRLEREAIRPLVEGRPPVSGVVEKPRTTSARPVSRTHD